MSLSHGNYDFNHGRNRMGRDIPQSAHFRGTPCPWVGGGRALTQEREAQLGTESHAGVSLVHSSIPIDSTIAFVGAEGGGKNMRYGEEALSSVLPCRTCLEPNDTRCPTDDSCARCPTGVPAATGHGVSDHIHFRKEQTQAWGSCLAASVGDRAGLAEDPGADGRPSNGSEGQC